MVGSCAGQHGGEGQESIDDRQNNKERREGGRR